MRPLSLTVFPRPVTFPHAFSLAMKFIHTADWHLGQQFHQYDRESEHRHFFDSLEQLMRREQPDALLVCGDVFHTSTPSAAAQKLMVEGVLRLHAACPSCAIIVTAGNHDSGSRLESHRDLWELHGVKMVGGCHREPDGNISLDRFLVRLECGAVVATVPYFHRTAFPSLAEGTPVEDREHTFFHALTAAARTAAGDRPVVVMAHLAVTGSDRRCHEQSLMGNMLTENLDDLGDGYDYLALGHIHRPQEVRSGRRFGRYAGSPLAVSFSEDFDHSVSVVQIGAAGEPPRVSEEILEPLIPLRTVKAKGADLDACLRMLAALPDDCTEYVRVIAECDGPLPADAEQRALRAVEGKKVRFCEIRRKAPAARARGAARSATEIEELRTIPPAQVAAEHYARRFDGAPLPERLSKLLDQCISAVSSE